jgi:hypothetical protein
MTASPTLAALFTLLSNLEGLEGVVIVNFSAISLISFSRNSFFFPAS